VINMVSFAAIAMLATAFTRPRPQVVIGVSVHPLAALAAWAVAFLLRARFVFEVTDLWPQTLIEFGRLAPNGVTARVMRGLERFLYRRADRIVMLWRDTAPYVRLVAGVEERIVWIPHVVDVDRYRTIGPYDGGHPGSFLVMFTGGFLKANCVDVIIDTAAELERRGRNDIRFELIGSGSEKPSIVAIAQERGLKSVSFPDPVPKAALASVLSRADAVIYGVQNLPLYDYGISLNKLTDYLASGRPIVFFGRSSYDPVRDSDLGASVPSGAPADIADAIIALVERSPEERRAMGERAKAHLLRFHDLETLTTRLETVLA
jgi:glycosyltransferase involved in cell wall biosynthesis